MNRTVRQLRDLEIDEISLVDRPANQHGLVAIAKRAGDAGMPIYLDTDGYEVTEEDLEIGETVFDADTGEPFVYLDAQSAEEAGIELDDDDDYDVDDEYDDDYDDDEDMVGVGKARNPLKIARQMHASRSYRGNQALNASQRANPGYSGGGRGRSAMTRAGMRGRDAAGTARGAVRDASSRGRRAASGTARRGQNAALRNDIRFRSSSSNSPYRTAGAVGGGSLVVGGGGGYASGRRNRVKKSLGSQVYSELSKALDQDDRDEVIAKAMDAVDAADRRAARALQMVSKMQEEQELREYEQVAADYGLPVHPGRLAGVLKRASDFLPDEDLDLLDQVFAAAGQGLFNEVGSNGYDSGEVMGQVDAIVKSAVSKAGGELTPEQATTALFSANPDLYDQYIAEQG